MENENKNENQKKKSDDNVKNEKEIENNLPDEDASADAHVLHKVAVIGDKESVLGFNILGMEVFVTDDPIHAGTLLDTLARDGYGIIYITEPLAEKIEEKINEYLERTLPAIVPIPSILGVEGLGMNSIKDRVKKAVGIDIFGEE